MLDFDIFTEEIDDNRARNFMLLLYEDDENYEFNQVMFFIRGNYKNYAYIKHTPEKEESKEHYHVVLSLDNPTTEEQLAKRIGIPTRFVRRVKSRRGSSRYLTHIDYPNKIQFPLTDVIVSRSFNLEFYSHFDDLMNETDILDSIYGFINDNKLLDEITLEVELTKFIVSNYQFNKVFKRYYNTITKYIHSVASKNNL